MIPIFLLSSPLLLAAEPVPETDRSTRIVVTGSTRPIEEEKSPATVSVIDEERIRALGAPLAADLLRLVSGVSVATAGPPGSQSQVRVRGAEANHTVLLIDGIRFNDPASGNEARFELLSTEGIRRIEVVRGPQSALYGSEAIGGVVALFTDPQRVGADGSVHLEAGSNEFFRGAGAVSLSTGASSLSLYGGYQQSAGIDALGRGGERDGYKNLTAGGSARFDVADFVSFSVSGRLVEATSEFDGTDPATFRRADTLDESHSRIGAIRAAAALSPAGSKWNMVFGGTLLGSSNRNRHGDAPLNQTAGRRMGLDGLISHEFSTGTIGHRFSVGADYENERFEARDQAFFGATDQDRTRERVAVLTEWQARFGSLVTNVALRHDVFEGFADATTLRGSALVGITGPLSFRMSYGQGIARPTFYDLFGFFPGSFLGNPELRPERSRAFEGGFRYGRRKLSVSLTGFHQNLTDEIVDVFDPATFLSSTQNATGESRRSGIELEGEWRLSSEFTFSGTYTYLDSAEQQVSREQLLREVRRPRHSGSIGVDGRWRQFGAGVSLAYIGRRHDLDFDAFPPTRVTLQDYVLVDSRLGYRFYDAVEAFVRVLNLFSAEYQDVVGYATLGRTIYGGIRLRFGD